jgi:hypothetical protein
MKVKNMSKFMFLVLTFLLNVSIGTAIGKEIIETVNTVVPPSINQNDNNEIAAKIIFKNRMNIFQESEDVIFDITMNSPEKSQTLTIYSREMKKIKEIQLENSGKETINLGKLPLGYYIIYLDEKRLHSYVIVPDLSNRYQGYDSPFAVDLNLGRMVNRVKNVNIPELSVNEKIDYYFKTLQLANIRYVRERNDLRVCFKNGPKSFDANNSEGEVRRRSLKYNIKISTANHDSIGSEANFISMPPEKSKGANIYQSSKFQTANLLDLYNMYFNYAKTFKKEVSVFELWNEEDAACFNLDTPDRCASYHKAIALAVKNANPDAKITTASLTCMPYDFQKEYMEGKINNNFFAYSDIFNIHIYTDNKLNDSVDRTQTNYNDHIGNELKFIEKAEANGIPIWMTECGTLMNCPKDCNDYFNEKNEDYILNSYSPLKLSLKGIENGIDKIFTFLYLPTGGAHYYYVLTQNGMATLNYATIATMTRMLDEKKYKGLYKIADKDISLYVFNDEKSGNKTFVYWVNTFENLTRKIPFSLELNSLSPLTQVKYTGETEVIKPETKTINLTASSEPVYLVGDFQVPQLIPVRYKAHDNPIAWKKYSEIVMQLNPGDDQKIYFEMEKFPYRFAINKKTGYYLFKPEIKNQLKVTIYNFSQNARKGTLVIRNKNQIKSRIELGIPDYELNSMSKIDIPLFITMPENNESDEIYIDTDDGKSVLYFKIKKLDAVDSKTGQL